MNLLNGSDGGGLRWASVGSCENDPATEQPSHP